MTNQRTDLIVVGAGHAGAEAAWFAAKRGCRVTVYTINLDLVGQMSCNPAIGGLAKGHMVVELDAMGGLMPILADQTGIQFKLLNRSRGAAVQAPRCQSDKIAYRHAVARALNNHPLITVRQGIVASLMIQGNQVTGVRLLDGDAMLASAVVLTTGTFLGGKIFIGEAVYQAGRTNELASVELDAFIRDLGFRLGRMKTGTPARLARDSIDFSKFEEQPGDESPTFFSHATQEVALPQVSCYLGYTSDLTKKIIEDNLHRSPLFSGEITGVGPRYCPSLEDKYKKFPDKPHHQLFLEPESLQSEEIYVNGMSTSMPMDVQWAMIRSVPGLEHAQLLRPGYAVEYTHIDPTELFPTLACKQLDNLYFAGQINGTSGYEEAAVQGMVAGLNAALRIQNEEPTLFSREKSYIGVLIDDLVTKGADEPYRMFTARAEHRLLLDIFSADERLTEEAFRLGLVDKPRIRQVREKYYRIHQAIKQLEQTKIKPSKDIKNAFSEHDLQLNKVSSLAELLRQPQSKLSWFAGLVENHEEMMTYETTIVHKIRYQPYIEKQLEELRRQTEISHLTIPRNFPYATIPGLTRELQEKLQRIQPITLDQATRISGMTPSAIAILGVYLKRLQRSTKHD